MDPELSRTLFVAEVEKLKKVMGDWMNVDDITTDGKIIYINLPKKSDGKKFLLRITCDEEFPLQPADYVFVNPETKQDDGKEFWSDDNQDALKTNENPRWICLAGTRAYKNHHTDHQFNPKVNSLAQTVFHIFRQINGWKKIA